MKTVMSIINGVASTSSTTQKKKILEMNKDNELLKEVLYYTYNPHLKYKITENTDFTVTGLTPFINLFDMLNILASNNINDELKGRVSSTLALIEDEELREFYKKVLLKDLRCNISDKTVNKVWKDLIPTHDIMLASKFEGDLKGTVAISVKMDGIRVSALVENDEVTWLTRQGKEVVGLKELSREVLQMVNEDCFLDGELIAINDTNLNSGELFKKTTTLVNGKNEDKTGIKFVMFDYLPLNEYKEKVCTEVHSARHMKLRKMVNYLLPEHIDYIDILDTTSDVSVIHKLLKTVCEKGEEGLMLNYVNGKYEFKRSKQILKVKEFFTADLKVIGIEEGTGRNKDRLGALVVDYKGNEVRVGSGFSDTERDTIWANSNDIIGRVIEVKYFEESSNKKGEISLRFPTFVGIREEGKEVSYH